MIVENKQITKSDYFIKSEGYSFGSETNKKNVSKKIIEKNILNFLELIELNYSNQDCKN